VTGRLGGLGATSAGFGRTKAPVSASPLVLVDEAGEDIRADNPSVRAGLHPAWHPLLEPEPAVAPRRVVVVDVGGEHHFEMSPCDDEEMVEAVFPHGAHEPLGEGVRPG
jgi:hypothetical protein